VHITYDVDTQKGLEKRELPFVMGVIGDFGGHAKSTKGLHERGFVKIDRDNFDQIMAGIKPAVTIAVPSPVDPTKEVPVNLVFSSMEDFRPDRIAEQVPHLQKLLEERELMIRLKNAINDPALQQRLEQMIDDWAKQRRGGSS